MDLSFLIFGGGLIGGTGIHMGRQVRIEIDRWQRAAYWHRAPGLITDSEFVQGRSGGEMTSDAEIEYTFEVDGEEYYGDTLLVGAYVESHAQTADWCRRYPEGAEVEVLYNSDDPEESCLVRSEMEPGFMVLLTQGMVVVGALMLVVGLWKWIS